MKTYLFELHFQEKNLQAGFNYQRMMFECDADAMKRARDILREGKRDVQAFLISLYVNRGDWKHIISYQ